MWITWIRAMSIAMVVYLHVMARITQSWGKVPIDEWQLTNITVSLGRVCVPLFFMVSGYLSLIKYENWKIFYKKRLLSIVLPFVFWWLVYFLYEGNTDKYHFWFMWVILPIFVIAPLLNKFKKWKYVIFLIMAGFLSKYTSYVAYFLLGYWLVEKKFLEKISTKVMLLVYFLCGMGTAWLTWKHTLNLGYFDEKYYSYYAPLVLLGSVALFLVFYKTKYENSIIAEKLAKHSFSIYLCHLLILERTYSLGPVLQFALSLFGGLVLAMIVDRLIVWIQQKISP